MNDDSKLKMDKDYHKSKENKSIIEKNIKIDRIKQRYPYCIVWTPLPCISWFFPSIGHVGICDSEGIIYDFAGPYFVSIDNMTFGNPTKYVSLELNQKQINEYDKMIEESRNNYEKQMYNLITNNCHSFVANVLNRINYKGRNNYSMFDIWWFFSTKSKYLSWIDLLKSYSGFIVIVLLCYIFYSLLKF